MIHKNDLIDKFSASMGNSEKRFIEFAISNGISNYKALIKEFTLIQNSVYDYIYKITEPNLQLTTREIETISTDFLNLKSSGLIQKESKL